MKKIAFITMAAFLLFAACKKEPINEPQPQTDTAPTVSLAGTTWVGSYDDNYRGYPATLMWSIDFLTDSTGTLHLDIVIAANPQPSIDDNFTYTFDGREICGLIVILQAASWSEYRNRGRFERFKRFLQKSA
jgi:hypothetical protein